MIELKFSDTVVDTRIDLKFYDMVGEADTSFLPEVKTEQSACADVKARFHAAGVTFFDDMNVKRTGNVYFDSDDRRIFTLHPYERACIPTGWRVIIPHGYQMKLVPRSGLALKFGITLINTPGTIDSDYTDELMVILHNTSRQPYVITEGDSIAQMEIVPNNMPNVEFSVIADILEVRAHKSTSNREGGFGSTGK